MAWIKKIGGTCWSWDEENETKKCVPIRVTNIIRAKIAYIKSSICGRQNTKKRIKITRMVSKVRNIFLIGEVLVGCKAFISNSDGCVLNDLLTQIIV